MFARYAVYFSITGYKLLNGIIIVIPSFRETSHFVVKIISSLYVKRTQINWTYLDLRFFFGCRPSKEASKDFFIKKKLINFD